MPTYEFKCGKCGHLFERFLAITDNSRIDCPVCGEPARRLISPGIGLIFKGTGFYATDYRKQNKPANKSEDRAS